MSGEPAAAIYQVRWPADTIPTIPTSACRTPSNRSKV